MNLFGAMAGGVLEYNSMYFGFRSLYWIAIVCYGAALAFSFAVQKRARLPMLEDTIRG